MILKETAITFNIRPSFVPHLERDDSPFLDTSVGHNCHSFAKNAVLDARSFPYSDVVEQIAVDDLRTFANSAASANDR